MNIIFPLLAHDLTCSHRHGNQDGTYSIHPHMYHGLNTCSHSHIPGGGGRREEGGREGREEGGGRERRKGGGEGERRRKRREEKGGWRGENGGRKERSEEEEQLILTLLHKGPTKCDCHKILDRLTEHSSS